MPSTTSGADASGQQLPADPEAVERAAWLRLFLAAVTAEAQHPGTFTTFEMARRRGVPEPVKHHMWGTGTRLARAMGIIAPAPAAVQSLRPRTRRSLVRTWIGARFATEPADDLLVATHPKGGDR